MFQGDFSFDGAPLIMNILMLTAFMTVVLLLAQEDDLVIPVLDLVQSLVCWPTFYECLIITSCLWCFRHIERIMGTRILVNFLLYNFITFLPFYVVVIYFFGFQSHFSFLYFVPFGLFVYILWNLPSITVSGKLEDKMLMTIMFLVIMLISFPLAFIPLGTAIIGNILFHFDLFRLKKCVHVDDDTSDFGEIHPNNNNNNNNNQGNGNNRPTQNQFDNHDPSTLNNNNEDYHEQLESMTGMGFTEEESLDALRRYRGNMEEAINHLLENR